MDCETCNALLDDYKRVVKLFKNAVDTGQGALETDSRLTGKRAAHLSEMCKNASDRLMDHWRKEHARFNGLSGTS